MNSRLLVAIQLAHRSATFGLLGVSRPARSCFSWTNLSFFTILPY